VPQDEIAAIYIYGREARGGLRSATVVEHISFGELQSFLTSRAKEHGSILQQFVVPRDERNHCLSVAWTPRGAMVSV